MRGDPNSNDTTRLESEVARLHDMNEGLYAVIVIRNRMIAELQDELATLKSMHSDQVNALQDRLDKVIDGVVYNDAPEHLTAAERRLAAHCLDIASDVFSNHGCNDFNLMKLGLTRDERVALDKAMNESNGTPEEHDPDGEHKYTNDWWLMSYLSTRLDADD